jgi:hypothetical protein
MPFVPFIIIVTNAVHSSDIEDLARLEAFVQTLKPSDASPVTSTHPYRLYGLLCQIARPSVQSSSSRLDPTLDNSLLAAFGDVDFSAYFGTTVDQGFAPDEDQLDSLGNWFYNNQQMMNLLDGDATFQGL